jgi:predicted anti-sigma-YlaC factor YlaD
MTRNHTDSLLRSLLGPSGPELTCEACFDELDFYVERSLAGDDPGATVPGMQAHLQGCPACREDYESLLALAGDEQTPEGEQR